MIDVKKYLSNQDDDNVYLKQKVKQVLVNCDALIKALHNTEFENQGAENAEYFGVNIVPYLIIPETQAKVRNYVCYTTASDGILKDNHFFKVSTVKFTIMCAVDDGIDLQTGIARHDLIAAILREEFNWSNIFGLHCEMTTDYEGVTDTSFATRTIIFEMKSSNNVLRDGRVINREGRQYGIG